MQIAVGMGNYSWIHKDHFLMIFRQCSQQTCLPYGCYWYSVSDVDLYHIACSWIWNQEGLWQRQMEHAQSLLFSTQKQGPCRHEIGQWLRWPYPCFTVPHAHASINFHIWNLSFNQNSISQCGNPMILAVLFSCSRFIDSFYICLMFCFHSYIHLISFFINFLFQVGPTNQSNMLKTP